MKKISFFAVILTISSSLFAHQVAGEFQNKSWDWNDGSHMLSKVMDGKGMNSMPATMHTHKEVKKTMEKPMREKTIQSVVKSHKMEEVDKMPMYDTGMRPSSSK